MGLQLGFGARRVLLLLCFCAVGIASNRWWSFVSQIRAFRLTAAKLFLDLVWGLLFFITEGLGWGFKPFHGLLWCLAKNFVVQEFSCDDDLWEGLEVRRCNWRRRWQSNREKQTLTEICALILHHCISLLSFSISISDCWIHFHCSSFSVMLYHSCSISILCPFRILALIAPCFLYNVVLMSCVSIAPCEIVNSRKQSWQGSERGRSLEGTAETQPGVSFEWQSQHLIWAKISFQVFEDGTRFFWFRVWGLQFSVSFK